MSSSQVDRFPVRSLSLWIIALVILSLVAACGQAAPSQSSSQSAQTISPVKWRFSTQLAPRPHEQGLEYEYLAKMINERTNGQISLEVSYSGALGFKGPEMLRVLKDGLVESGEIFGPYVSSEVPWLSVMDFVSLFRSNEDLVAATKAVRPMVEELGAKFDTKILAVWHHVGHGGKGGLVLYTNRDIKSLDDMKGMKIRGHTAVHADALMNQLGAAVVFIPPADIYSSLKTGVVDGALTGIAGLVPLKMYEVTKYMYPMSSSLITSLIAFGVSNKYYNALPSNLQKTLVDVGKDFEAREWDVDFYPEKYQPDHMTWQQLMDFAKDHNIQLKDLPAGSQDKFREIMSKTLPDWAKKNGTDAEKAADLMMKAVGLK